MDHYATLELPKTCTTPEILAAYRRLALIWHPDRFWHPASTHDNPTAAATRFRQISEAYQILSDVNRRRAYDLSQNPASNNNTTPRLRKKSRPKSIPEPPTFQFQTPEQLFQQVFGQDPIPQEEFDDGLVINVNSRSVNVRNNSNRGPGGVSTRRNNVVNVTSRKRNHGGNPPQGNIFSFLSNLANSLTNANANNGLNNRNNGLNNQNNTATSSNSNGIGNIASSGTNSTSIKATTWVEAGKIMTLTTTVKGDTETTTLMENGVLKSTTTTTTRTENGVKITTTKTVKDGQETTTIFEDDVFKSEKKRAL